MQVWWSVVVGGVWSLRFQGMKTWQLSRHGRNSLPFLGLDFYLVPMLCVPSSSAKQTWSLPTADARMKEETPSPSAILNMPFLLYYSSSVPRSPTQPCEPVHHHVPFPWSLGGLCGQTGRPLTAAGRQAKSDMRNSLLLPHFLIKGIHGVVF